MKATEEEILQRISEGKTASEIMEEFGYRTDSFIYSVAKMHNVRITRQAEKKADTVRKLRSEGKMVSEIASILNMSIGGVNDIIKRYSIPHNPKKETRICKFCGKEFETEIYSEKKYCSIGCQRKCCRTIQGQANDKKAIEYISKYPEWEYVNGYTGSDGSMNVMHKDCGHVYTKSCITIRTGGTIICEHCIQVEIEEKNKRKKIAKEWAKQNKRPLKYKIDSLKECAICGALFVSSGNASCCSDECRRAKLNHYYNMKKEKRRRAALTEESKHISIKSIYERDGGICWLCGNPCDMTADSNSDDYPSIDHVIPISMGGKDTFDNVRIAHRGCNTRKGARIIEDPNATLCSPGVKK